MGSKYQNICRLCSSHLAEHSPHSLLDNSTIEMFEALSHIKLEARSKGPKKICTKCFLNLSFAYKIQQSIIKAEEKLQATLSMEQMHKEIQFVDVKSIINKRAHASLPDLIRISDEENCIICGEIVQSGNKHFRAHFEASQHCGTCDGHFENFDSYKRHLAVCKFDEAGYECSKCGAKFLYKSFYDLHNEKLHSELGSERRCHIEQLITSKAAIDVLLRDEEGFRCEECGKFLKSKSSLASHTHQTKKCPICQKDVRSAQFSVHVRDHQGPQICEICGSRLKSPSSLRMHIFYSHNELKITCEECGQEFRKRHLYNMHLKKHRGEKNDVCDQCGKSFFNRRLLQRHIDMTHLKLRPNVCKYCKRGFSSKYALKTHERQHTNETPYRCDICSEGFRQKVSLKSHQKSKHGIVEPKTVQCKICQKGFGCKQALLAHNRLHM